MRAAIRVSTGPGGIVRGLLVAVAVLFPEASGAQVANRPVEHPIPAQHRPIYLRTGTGEIINPQTGQNAREPYSPAATCGASKCHDYAQIVRAYHFQQGAERVRDDFDSRQPWVLSNGMFGGYRPAALRQLAKKKSRHPDEIDLTVWEWVTGGPPDEPSCAGCHPGGGPLEYDRDGKRYDRTLAANPALAQSLDGDYRGSRWDKSGVLESDCLLCHYPAFDWETRWRQIKAWNLRWAPTAASGIGRVDGQVFDPTTGKLTGKTPTVVYNRRLFDEDGKVVLSLLARGSDRSCVQCHGEPDMQKRGFSWNDLSNPDIHNQRGIGCPDCHPARRDHNFVKGRTVIETVRDDLDNSMLGCRECHTQGVRAATLAKHYDIPPSHMRKIACKTCHIPALHRAAGKFFDSTLGDTHWDVVSSASRVGAPETWYPSYEEVDGQLVPVNPIFGIWWGNQDADGIIYPLFARELKAAWQLYKDQVKDDSGDGIPEVNTREEIAQGLRAFARVLAGNARFKRVHPVYIKGDKLWELGPEGHLTSRWDEVCARRGFSVSHNVAPVKQALGAGGCEDCHSREGKFFSRTYVVDPFDESGKEVRAPVYQTLGLTDLSFTLFSIYWSLARPYIGVILLIVFLILFLHFTRFGPHDFGGHPVEPRPDDHERITRFSAFERLLHLCVLGTFLFLGFTGLAFSFNGWRWMHLFFGDGLTPRVWHGWLGWVFGAGVLLMGVRWWRDAILVRSDRQWFRALGGYLGGHDPVPAGRFNAGQKIYFWSVILGGLTLLGTGIILFYLDEFSINVVFIAALLHNLAGLFGVAGVVSHIYLSTAANPGTSQAIFAGWVTKGWARLHHPLWYEKVTGQKALSERAKSTGQPHEPKHG